MSIEKDIERIAVALENIANGVERPSHFLQSGAVKTTKPEKDALVKSVKEAPAVDQIPGIDDAEDKGGPQPTVMAVVGIKTLEDLRTFVQKYLTVAEKALPPKTEAVVTFVKDTLCPKFAPKEPKLMKIPVGKVTEAATMMYDWGLKNGLIIG